MIFDCLFIEKESELDFLMVDNIVEFSYQFLIYSYLIDRVRYEPLCVTMKTFRVHDISNEKLFSFICFCVESVYVEFIIKLFWQGIVGEEVTERVEHFNYVV